MLWETVVYQDHTLHVLHERLESYAVTNTVRVVVVIVSKSSIALSWSRQHVCSTDSALSPPRLLVEETSAALPPAQVEGSTDCTELTDSAAASGGLEACACTSLGTPPNFACLIWSIERPRLRPDVSISKRLLPAGNQGFWPTLNGSASTQQSGKSKLPLPRASGKRHEWVSTNVLALGSAGSAIENRKFQSSHNIMEYCNQWHRMSQANHIAACKMVSRLQRIAEFRVLTVNLSTANTVQCTVNSMILFDERFPHSCD